MPEETKGVTSDEPSVLPEKDSKPANNKTGSMSYIQQIFSDIYDFFVFFIRKLEPFIKELV